MAYGKVDGRRLRSCSGGQRRIAPPRRQASVRPTRAHPRPAAPPAVRPRHPPRDAALPEALHHRGARRQARPAEAEARADRLARRVDPRRACRLGVRHPHERREEARRGVEVVRLAQGRARAQRAPALQGRGQRDRRALHPQAVGQEGCRAAAAYPRLAGLLLRVPRADSEAGGLPRGGAVSPRVRLLERPQGQGVRDQADGKDSQRANGRAGVHQVRVPGRRLGRHHLAVPRGVPPRELPRDPPEYGHRAPSLPRDHRRRHARLHRRGEEDARRHAALCGGGDGVPAHPADQAADARPRALGLARGGSGLDRGEVPRVDRSEGGEGLPAHHLDRQAPDQCHDLLRQQRHHLVHPPLLRDHEARLRDLPRGRVRPHPACGNRHVPQGNLRRPQEVGGKDVPRPGQVRAVRERRAFRGHGGARGAAGGSTGVPGDRGGQKGAGVMDRAEGGSRPSEHGDHEASDDPEYTETALPRPVFPAAAMATREDGRAINSLMDAQRDISYRFAGDGVDYKLQGTDRSPETLERVDKLLKDGYVIIEKLVPEELCRKVKDAVHSIPGYTGKNYLEGETTRRVDHLVNKLSVVEPLVMHPKVLAILDHVLNPNYLLSASQAIEILPGEHKQPWHNDDNYTRAPRPRKFFFVNCFWAMDDFTRENGGTHIIPGSHLWGEDRYPEPNDPEQGIRFAAPAGSVCLFVSTAWHAGGANTTTRPRMAVACVYGEPWVRPYENHFLVTDPATVLRMPQRLQALLGYSVCTPLVGRVDGRHPIRALEREEGGKARVRYAERIEDAVQGGEAKL